MGRHRIRVKITAGEANSRDMMAWIEAFAAHHRTDTGEQAWTVSNRFEPEPLGTSDPSTRQKSSSPRPDTSPSPSGGLFFVHFSRTCGCSRYATGQGQSGTGIRGPAPGVWTGPGRENLDHTGGFLSNTRKCYEIVLFCPNFVPLLRIIRRKAGPAGQVTGRSGGELSTRPCTGENFLSLYCNSFSRSGGPFFT